MTLIIYCPTEINCYFSAGHDTYAYLAKAFEKYKMAESYEEIFRLGSNVQQLAQEVWQNNDKLLQLSSLCYQTLLSTQFGGSKTRAYNKKNMFHKSGNGGSGLALSLDYLGLYNWGRVLIKQARKSGSDDLYAQAGDKFRR